MTQEIRHERNDQKDMWKDLKMFLSQQHQQKSHHWQKIDTMNKKLARSDFQVRKESWTASNETQLKKMMSSKLINLKISKCEIIKL